MGLSPQPPQTRRFEDAEQVRVSADTLQKDIFYPREITMA